MKSQRHHRRRRDIFGIGNITDSLGRSLERLNDGINETLFEPVVRLGVTGLSRAGKTIFITSLVANLLNRGRMVHLQAAAQGRIRSAFLQPQPDDMVPRFDYENFLAEMTGEQANWPQSTRSISTLRLSLKVQPQGFLSGFQGPKTIHLDIVDYPGEWLLDLPLMGQSFEEWSKSAIALARRPERADHGANWLSKLDNLDPAKSLDEPLAQELAAAFTDYLAASRKSGLSACAPGRFLMPGDLEGSPALTFTPLPKAVSAPRKSLYRAFERRFEAYKSGVIRPFFRDHFSRIDRQIVLADLLGAIHAGPQAVEDLRQAMKDILSCFKVGQNGFFSFLTGHKVDKILFAATKADHLHHSQHPQLTALTEALLADVKAKADYSGAETKALAMAALRATVEQEVPHQGQMLPAVKGRLLSSGKTAVMYAGELPEDPAHLLNPARQGAENWLNGDYSVMAFAPAPISIKPGDGPPHIRLDQAAEFLLGDRLQ